MATQEHITIELDKTPKFSKTLTTTADIAAGATSTQEFIEEGDQYSHAPFDIMIIDSTDASNELQILLDLNPENYISVPPNTSKSFNALAFRRFAIKNNGAALHTAGTIKVQVMSTKTERRT